LILLTANQESQDWITADFLEEKTMGEESGEQRDTSDELSMINHLQQQLVNVKYDLKILFWLVVSIEVSVIVLLVKAFLF
jgi:hypothetical protein